MHAAALLVVLLEALLGGAFNLDSTHPLLWTSRAKNFGYKVDFRQDNRNYSLTVAAIIPSPEPQWPGDNCLEYWGYLCPIEGNRKCKHDDSVKFPNLSLNITEGIHLNTSWSEKPAVCRFNDRLRHFQVKLPNSNHWNPIWQSEEWFQGQTCNRPWCVTDLNGDGSQDLVLGSPHHPQGDHSKSGVVYVYINKEEVQPENQVVILGKYRNGQFGSSVSCIGDINDDGYQDVVVGAPYEDKGRGAIYLYHGSKTGLNLNYSQKIYGSQVEKNQSNIHNIRGFGFSISRGVDIDDNQYSDIAVGVINSNAVVLLRSRPVVRMLASLSTRVDEMNEVEQRLPVTYHLNFTSAHVFETPVEVEVRLQSDTHLCLFENTTLCAEDPSKTLYSNKHTFYMNKTITQQIRLTHMLGAKMLPKPIQLTLKFKLVESTEGEFCKTCPVVDPRDEESTTLTVNHNYFCGNHTCRPDLKLHAAFIGNITQAPMGEKKTVTIRATVKNLQERAFFPTVILKVPFYFPVVGSSPCLNRSSDNTAIHLECEVTSILTRGDSIRSVFWEFEIKDIPAEKEKLQFNIFVTSLGEEQYQEDNYYILPLNVQTSFYDTCVGNSSGVPSAVHVTTDVPGWIPLLAFVGGFLACALLIALAIAVSKIRSHFLRKKEQSYTMDRRSIEPEYEDPNPYAEPVYSRENQYYES